MRPHERSGSKRGRGRDHLLPSASDASATSIFARTPPARSLLARLRAAVSAARAPAALTTPRAHRPAPAQRWRLSLRRRPLRAVRWPPADPRWQPSRHHIACWTPARRRSKAACSIGGTTSVPSASASAIASPRASSAAGGRSACRCASANVTSAANVEALATGDASHRVEGVLSEGGGAVGFTQCHGDDRREAIAVRRGSIVARSAMLVGGPREKLDRFRQLAAAGGRRWPGRRDPSALTSHSPESRRSPAPRAG